MLAQVATQVPGDEKAQDEKRASICLTAGTVCVSVGQDAAAEHWYRELLRLSPQRFEPLALALARQHDSDKLREAISLCQAAATTDKSTQPALALAAVLMAGKPKSADFADAEGLLQSTLARHRDDVGLLFSIGSLRIVAGRSNDAIELFRKVIRINPDHVFALNNLATVLGEHAEHRQEALELIDRALQRAGSQPALYDTKGMILVYDGQADEALTYLERAAGSSSKDPRYQLHLAKAYKDNGALANAREEMIKALEGDLEKTILTGGDRRLLVELTPLVDELQ
jgi:tetratricopeptide (TPR) repeat protein